MQITKDQLPLVAAELVSYLKEKAESNRATILALSGDLGAGKTTLIQEIARVLGVEESVPSPTFVIMKYYKLMDERFERLVHMDAYRMESKEELRPLHLESVFMDGKALLCVEWPERLYGELPADVTKLTLSVAGEHDRLITTSPELLTRLEARLK